MNFKLTELWQLPQNILGIIYKRWIRKDIITRIDYSAVEYECYLTRGHGVSTIGRYIFIQQKYVDLTETLKHEKEYVKLSRFLGIFYLPIIGIPYIIMKIFPVFNLEESYIEKLIKWLRDLNTSTTTTNNS